MMAGEGRGPKEQVLQSSVLARDYDSYVKTPVTSVQLTFKKHLLREKRKKKLSTGKVFKRWHLSSYLFYKVINLILTKRKTREFLIQIKAQLDLNSVFEI